MYKAIDLDLISNFTRLNGLISQIDYGAKKNGQVVATARVLLFKSNPSAEANAGLICLLEDTDLYSAAGFVEHFTETATIAFIDELRVERAQRQAGIGSFIMQGILSNLDVDIVALETCPEIDGVEYEKILDHQLRVDRMRADEERLKIWYARHGFDEVGEGNYMKRQGSDSESRIEQL